jgi:hypothetical protein
MYLQATVAISGLQLDYIAEITYNEGANSVLPSPRWLRSRGEFPGFSFN